MQGKPKPPIDDFTWVVLTIVMLITVFLILMYGLGVMGLTNFSPAVTEFECGAITVAWPNAPKSVEGSSGYLSIRNDGDLDTYTLGWAGFYDIYGGACEPNEFCVAKWATFYFEDGQSIILSGEVSGTTISGLPTSKNLSCGSSNQYLPLLVRG